MVKGLEGKMYEEQLRCLGLFSPEQSRPRGGLMAACSSLKREAEGRVLSSALWGQRQDPRERHGAGAGEGQAGCEGKVLHPEVIGHWDRLPKGSGHSIELPEFKKRFDNSLRHRVWFWVILCRPIFGQEKVDNVSSFGPDSRAAVSPAIHASPTTVRALWCSPNVWPMWRNWTPSTRS